MLISIIGNLITAVGLVQGINIIREKNFKNKRSILSIFIFSIFLIATMKVKKLKILIFLLSILIYVIDYYGEKERDIKKSVIRTIVIMGIYLVSDVGANIVINILFKFQWQSSSRIHYVILNYIFICFLSKIFGKVIKITENIGYLSNERKNKAYYIWMNVFLCICAVLLNFKFNRKLGIINREVYLTNLILFSSAILSSIFSAYIFNKVSLNELEMKIKSEEIKHVEEYAKYIEELYSDIRVFKHDYKNILLSLGEYIEEKRYDELEIYFKENILASERSIDQNDFWVKLKNIKILPLKSIIISKLIKANNKYIDVFIDISEEIDNIPMEYIDSIRVFGILLDNAIEESVKCSDKKINFAIVKKEKSMVFIIQNSCCEDVSCIYKLFQKGFSTKGEGRGVGLYNLKRILNNYKNITLNMENKNNIFTAELWIREF